MYDDEDDSLTSSELDEFNSDVIMPQDGGEGLISDDDIDDENDDDFWLFNLSFELLILNLFIYFVVHKKSNFLHEKFIVCFDTEYFNLKIVSMFYC